jgi:tetratricopeptide (TPR) repeat protein
LNRLDEARAYYKKAILVAENRCRDRLGASFQTCPERGAPSTALASITGRRTQAIRLFRQGLGDDPDSLATRQDLAVILSRKNGGKREAESLWKEVLSRQPDYLPALLAYADFLKTEQRFGEAIPLLRAVLKQRQDYLPAAIDLSVALMKAGRPDQAAAWLDDVLARNPGNPAVWASRAQVLQATGRKKEAAEARRQARLLKKQSSASTAPVAPSR